MYPVIAAQGCRWSIDVVFEENILRKQKECNAVLAVNTDESYDRRKFIAEIENTLNTLPLVGLIENQGRVLLILERFSTKVTFRKGHHMEKCPEVASRIREVIKRAKSARVKTTSNRRGVIV